MACKLQQIKKHYASPQQATLRIHVCKADTRFKFAEGSRTVIGSLFSILNTHQSLFAREACHSVADNHGFHLCEIISVLVTADNGNPSSGTIVIQTAFGCQEQTLAAKA